MLVRPSISLMIRKPGPLSKQGGWRLMQAFEAGKPLKCNPLAYWEFRDCWDYVEAKQLEYHPLHDQVNWQKFSVSYLLGDS